jgi:hypothetical protein
MQNKEALQNYLERLEGINNDWYIDQLRTIPAPPDLLSKIAEQSKPPEENIPQGILEKVALIQTNKLSTSV